VRLVLVHGINQHGRSSTIIRAEWLSSMEAALGERDCFDHLDIATPFYGDDLAREVGTPTVNHVVAQGVFDGEEEELAFIADGLTQLAQDSGMNESQVAEEEEAVDQGLPHDRRLIAIIRLLERASPLQGEVALRLLKQAYAYLRRPHVTEAIDAIVKPALEAGPSVIVAHSLGSVVTFKLLREFEASGRSVPLYVTIGSPLGIVSVKAGLGRPRHVPRGVARWLNGLDVNDFVTLGRGLTEETFAQGIENLTDIDNHPDPHAATHYLRHAPIAKEILAAVRSEPSR
jgi:hypothetical protein